MNEANESTGKTILGEVNEPMTIINEVKGPTTMINEVKV